MIISVNRELEMVLDENGSVHRVIEWFDEFGEGGADPYVAVSAVFKVGDKFDRVWLASFDEMVTVH